jgi:hypothetical protein
MRTADLSSAATCRQISGAELSHSLGRVETLRAGEADVPQVAVLDLETTALLPQR